MGLVNFLKKNVNYLLPILIFILVAVIYCKPVLDGLQLKQGDNITARGMKKEIQDHRDKYGEEPLWTGAAFSGMPSFTISTKYNENIIRPILLTVNNILTTPVFLLVMLSIGFFVLLISFDVNPWLACIGALAFAYSSNFLISIEAGHNTKVLSIAFMPGIIAGLKYILDNKRIRGTLVLAVFLCAQLSAGHFQITFYTAIAAGIFLTAYLIKAIWGETSNAAIQHQIVAIFIGVTVAILPNINKMYNLQSHTKESMRGGGSMLSSSDKKSDGLDFNYALDPWSYGVKESFTLMNPFFMGGASGETLRDGSNSHKTFKKYFRGLKKSDPVVAPLYIGPQNFTSPIYLGITVFFFLILSFFVIKSYHRWWILAVAIISLFMAWGSHFPMFNKLLFYNFPLFNKFRNPTMALALIGMVVPLIGMLALDKVFKEGLKNTVILEKLKQAGIIMGCIFAFLFLNGAIQDFKGPQDDAATVARVSNQANAYFGNNNAQQKQRFIEDYSEAIRKDRKSLYMSHSLKGLIYVGLIFLILFYFLKGKMRKEFALGGIGIILLIDLISIGFRYFDHENFEKPKNINKVFALTEADKMIKQDNDPHYRVLNFGQSMFSDGVTPYKHRSILGYSAAKVQLYQDLVNSEVNGELFNQINKIPQIVNGQRQVGPNDPLKRNLPVIHMLNAKYLMFGAAKNQVMQNPYACGNAWFIENIKLVENADEEMRSLANFDPSTTALMDKSIYSGKKISSQTFNPAGSSIQLTEYRSNKLTYKAKAASDGFIVFSEVYYKNGWNCYVNGKKTNIFRVNYALRGIHVSAGDHDIVMSFEPISYKIGYPISVAGSIIFILLIIGGIYISNKPKKA